MFPFRERIHIQLEMAEQEQVIIDNVTVLKPAAAVTGPEVPPNKRTIEPLDVVEEPKVRTKLRIYAIVFALCVIILSPPQRAPDG